MNTVWGSLTLAQQQCLLDKHQFFQPALSWKVVQWEAMPREVHGVLQSTTLWYNGLYRLDQVCVWWKCYINCTTAKRHHLYQSTASGSTIKRSCW